MSQNESQSENHQGEETLVELPMDEKSQMQRVEAVLFLATIPLPSRKLADLASLEDGTQARTVVKLLNQHYDNRGRAFHIKQIAGGYQLMTRPQFSTWLRRMDHAPKVIRLSTPAMETLAVVAYRQPVLKAEIEAIRGVNCGEMLRQLLDRGLVTIAGRSEELGRPYFYGTTKKFLETFGLSRIEALPRAEDLKGRGLPKSVSSTQNGTNSSSEQNDVQSISETHSFSTDPQTPMEEPKVSVVDPQLITENEEITTETGLLVDLNPASPPTLAPSASDDLDDEEWEEWDDDEDDDDGDVEEGEEDDWEDEESDDDEYEDDEDDEDDDDEDWEDDGEGDYEDGDYEEDEYEDDDELEDHWEEVEDDDDEEEWEESDDEDDEDDEEWEEGEDDEEWEED